MGWLKMVRVAASRKRNPMARKRDNWHRETK